ncbi:MAG: FG-GAP-like repeat-containing protein [Phycisphaerales bacterium]
MTRPRFRACSSIMSAVLACGLHAASASAQLLPATIGLDEGPTAQVFVFGGGRVPFSFQPYPGFTGGVRVAMGDITGDGEPDVITGAGPGSPGGHIRVFDGTSNAVISSFFAFGPGFTGGVHVASGDVNGDGRDDIITGADAGGGPHVKVFDGATGGEIRSFFAYGTGFLGGVRVAAGDVNGDGFDDIITGAGAGGGPHVKVFDGATHAELHSFFAFPGFLGGVYVASGDVNGDGLDDIITGPDAGGPSIVRAFSPLNVQQPWQFPIGGSGPSTSDLRVGTTFRRPVPNEPNGIIAILIGLLVDNTPTLLRLNPATGEASTMQSFGNFPGVGLFVAGNPGPRRPVCRVDFNGDGNVDPDDLGDFINCFFSVPPCDRADFNSDGNVDPDDLGDFINEFFARNCG